MKNYPACKELNLSNANHVYISTDNSHEIVSLIQCHLFAYWVILHALLSSADFYQNQLRVSNKLNPGQARHFVGPDLDSNCLQRLSADETISG